MAKLNVISRWLLLLALLCMGNAWAAQVAVVSHISGTLGALKADGSSRVLSVNSSVDSGDTLSTQQGSFARIKFSDGGEVTLRPNSVFKVDNYAFDQAAPKQDGMVASLLKGGLRTVTGLIGKRGDKEAYRLQTSTATIGIRGTEYGVRVCQGNCPNASDGVYTIIYEGTIVLKNEFGEIECYVGQICYAAPGKAPVRLPTDPAEVDFALPAFFMDTINGEGVLDPDGHRQCMIR